MNTVCDVEMNAVFDVEMNTVGNVEMKYCLRRRNEYYL